MADIQYDDAGGGYGSGMGDVYTPNQLPKITTPGGTGSEATPAQPAANTNVPAPGNDANQIQGWYSQYLGRNATDAEIQNHLGNPGGLGAVQNLIANSSEATDYAKRSQLGPYKPQAPAAPAPPTSPSGYQGTSIFSDPATQQYEQLLNGLIGKLNTPYTPPGWDQTMSALQDYITKLNGPAYTPDQMNLFNTQAIDPIFAQRDADNQQIIQRFAAQGMGPSSGPVQAALLANNQKYGALADQARAGIAANGVNTQKSQQAQAMGYQLQIPTLETNLNSYNTGNALQAANLAGIIPNMAWNRLSGAQNAVGGMNPLGALSLLNAFQTQGYNQGADYSSQLMQVLPYLLKMFGVN